MKRSAFALVAALASPTWAGAWVYDFEIDPMTSKIVDFAYTEGGSLSLASPYQGKNVPRLNVRREAKGTFVYLEIEKGQIVGCVINCPVKVRFDDAPPVTFTGKGPSDYSSKVAFLLPADKFIAMARKAKTIRVQVAIYQASEPVMEFPAGPLVWPPKK